MVTADSAASRIPTDASLADAACCVSFSCSARVASAATTLSRHSLSRSAAASWLLVQRSTFSRASSA
eukprot:2544626-Prymnesium_polylepis.1